MNKTIKVMDAMRKVRQELEQHTYRKYDKRNDDLNGYCAVTSLKLFKSLHKILPIYMVGNEEHWFNIVQIDGHDYVIDITATQFDTSETKFNKHEFRKFPNSCLGYENIWDYFYVFSDEKDIREFLPDEDWMLNEEIKDNPMVEL